MSSVVPFTALAPEPLSWETVQGDDEGVRYHCLVDGDRLKGLVRTVFDAVEGVEAYAYADGVPEVFDVFPGLARLTEQYEGHTFPSLDLAKTALQSMEVH